MSHWMFLKVREGGFRFHWRDYLTPELITRLSPEQHALLRLGHDDPISEHFLGEVARERGKVFWSVV